MTDDHAELLASLADDASYDIIQLDPRNNPDLVGLLVRGKLRATYTKIAVYTETSAVASSILNRTSMEARASNYLIRNYKRAIEGAVGKRSQELPADVGDESTDMVSWETSEFVTPPLAPDQLPRPEQAEIPHVEVDMGRTITGKKVLDDIVLENTTPAFLESVVGLANEQKPTEDGW
jgi:hypothetical protein